jgi:hypothetical protein
MQEKNHFPEPNQHMLTFLDPILLCRVTYWAQTVMVLQFRNFGYADLAMQLGSFPKGPPLIFIFFLPLWYPVGTMGKKLKQFFSDIFCTKWCMPPHWSVPKVRAPQLHLRWVIMSGTPPLLERYFTHNRRYNVGALLMWIHLPTTQFDTTIRYKVVELLDVLCYPQRHVLYCLC